MQYRHTENTYIHKNESKHSEMGPYRLQRDKTQSRQLLVLFICVCIALCTIVAHNTAQNRPHNFPSYRPDNHCSDMREGGMPACKYEVIKSRLVKALTLRAPGRRLRWPTSLSPPFLSLAACIKVLSVLTSTRWGTRTSIRVENHSLAAALLSWTSAALPVWCCSLQT